MTDDAYYTIARFYDRTLAGFDADIDLYDAFARRSAAPVLELGVGTGRVALALARRGLHIVGIDRSAAMLAIARRAKVAEGLKRLTLVEGDMRAPPVSGSFGLIICARDSFLHLPDTDDQLATLRAARGLLAPAGCLVLDLPGPAGDWGGWEPGAQPLVLDWSEVTDAGRVSRYTTFRADAAAQTRAVTDIFEEIAPDGSVRRFVAEYRLRFVFPAEMNLLLRLAGLRLDGRYGDYDLAPFDAASERLIVVAARAERG